jgi:signal peptidase II
MHSYLGDLLRLQFAQNPGAFLSFGESLTPDLRYYAFVVGVSALVVAMLAWAVGSSRLTLLQRLALAAVSAGGLGNLIDRLRFEGSVTDFLNLGIGPLRTGIFNVADVVLTAGVIVLLNAWRSRKI